MISKVVAYLASPFTDIDQKRSTAGQQVPVLDGVRGFAVIIVMMAHCQVFGMAGQGHLGVLLFFMLSGFVLTLPLVDNPDAIYSPKFLARYAINRFLRIYPAFFVAVMVIFLFLGSWPDGWVTQNLTFQAGWNHLWSVTEEVRFYLLFPFTIMVVHFFSPLWIRLIFLTAMVLLARHFQYDAPVSMMEGGLAPFYYWYFLGGSLVCFVRPLIVPNRAARAALGFTAAAIVGISFLSSDSAIAAVWKPIFPNVPDTISSWGYYHDTWCLIIAALLFSLSVYPDSFAGRVFSSRPMRHIGLLSYGLYLFHMPVLAWLHQRGYRGIELFAGVASLTYIVALVSYLIIEKPAMMLKPRRMKIVTARASPASRGR
jgi:peptidoglycan/LPS O-acetylase OafA/YrhL